MNPQLPDRADIQSLALAIRAFEGFGSVDLLGNYQQGLDPRVLWLMMPLDSSSAQDVFTHAGGSPEKGSVFHELGKAEEIHLHVRCFKTKVSWRRSVWAGNVEILWGQSKVDVGSISGESQSEMWLYLESVLQLDRPLFDDTLQAIHAAANGGTETLNYRRV